MRPWAGGLVGVAYRTTPRKLGKVYCSNRPSVLFHLAEGAEQWTVITGGDPPTPLLYRIVKWLILTWCR